MASEELKKQMRAIDLAIAAAQKRLSPRTGFVHLYPNEDFTDTIPSTENFCYVLALFRTKLAENILQAIVLLNKLLAFQAQDGNFPIFLHEYPKCFDPHQRLKVGAILAYILRLYPNVLGSLKAPLEKALSHAIGDLPEKPLWQNRYFALKGLPLPAMEPNVLSPSDWTEEIITRQLAGQNHFEVPFDPALQLLTIPLPQEKGEPRPHPIEWTLAEGSYSSRHLRDHPHQILCAQIFPFEYTQIKTLAPGVRFFWRGSTLHSFEGQGLSFDLEPNSDVHRNDPFEVAFFCDRSPETEIFVEGKKGTLFQLNEKVTIQTPEKTLQLRFLLREGSGDFLGHIFPGNRPSQIAKGYEAYDWQIALRCLRRSKCRIEVQIK